MRIEVKYVPTPVKLEFMPTLLGQRMWIRDANFEWLPTIGWCPHINLKWSECIDCGLNLEE